MKYQNMKLGIRIIVVLMAFMAFPTLVLAKADDSKDAFVGTVEKIDAEAKMVYVKSKDGVVKAFKWTKKTTTHGIQEAIVWTDRAAHVGAHVVIRSLKVAGEDTIKGIHWFGQGTVKVVDVVVKHVGNGTKQVALAVSGEAQQIYDVSEHALVSTGKKITHGTQEIEKKTVKEIMAAVHIIDQNGKKFVHFIENKPKQ